MEGNEYHNMNNEIKYEDAVTRIYTTEKQYSLVEKVVPLMAALYRNDFTPLFRMFAEDYKSAPLCAEKAANIIKEIGITAPSPLKAKKLDALAADWMLNAHAVQEDLYRYAIELDESQRTLVSKTLDVFSRIAMGQFHILFETMDVPEAIKANPHAMQVYYDACWEGMCGAKEARDLLFPGIRECGWHGGYGISNPNVSENSRLAYQISRALNRDFVLPVTQEPIIQLKPSGLRHAPQD